MPPLRLARKSIWSLLEEYNANEITSDTDSAEFTISDAIISGEQTSQG